MFGKKYYRDYRMEDKLDARGKRHSVSVYIGSEYMFLTPARAGKRQRGWLLGLNMLSWLCFIGALIPRSLATDTFYCLLPFVLGVLTLLFSATALGGCALNALRAFPALLVGDAIFAGCAALLTAASAVILRPARGFKAEKKT